MKKEQVVILSLVLFALALFLINVHTVFAISINPNNPEDPLGIGINAGDIPQSPEDLANASASYLATRWNKFFTESAVLGPIHRAFLANPLPFKILFNEPYSFTLTFFCILVLWIFLLASFGNIVEAYSGSGMIGIVGGILFSIVFAQIGVINSVVKFFINYILIQNSVWVKVLLWVVAFVILALIFTFDSMWKKSIQASKKQNEKQRLKEKVGEHEEVIQGVKQVMKGAREMKEGYDSNKY